MGIFFSRYLKKDRVEDITWAALESFLAQKIEEHQTLEYKPRGLLVKRDDSIHKPSSSHDIRGFAALAKSVAGFANAEGGLLILGVKEKEEKYKGKTVKILPGEISPLPASISREIIENNLLSRIQHNIEGIVIVPIRQSPQGEETVYLIEVPQSIRAPHRVNEIYYYQRYNFSVLEMKHYQIADLFGRRLVPDLDVQVKRVKGANEEAGHFSIMPVIENNGGAVAKYFTIICKIYGGAYEICQAPSWSVREDKKTCQFKLGLNEVVYPEISNDIPYIEFKPLSENSNAPLVLDVALYAEGMKKKNAKITIDPSSPV